MSQAGRTRTTRRTLQFGAPLRLSAQNETLPAGRYDTVTTEAIHQGNERNVYQRISTVLIIVNGGTTRYCEVHQGDLEGAEVLLTRVED
jgi:hypothetical protein